MAIDRADGADADGDDAHLVVLLGGGDQLGHHRGERGVVRLGADVALDDRARPVDEQTRRR